MSPEIYYSVFYRFLALFCDEVSVLLYFYSRFYRRGRPLLFTVYCFESTDFGYFSKFILSIYLSLEESLKF